MVAKEITKVQWEILINRYESMKRLYIECEETDPELKTNLQPINEIRAALDHLMRVVAIEKLGNADHEIGSQFEEKKNKKSNMVGYAIGMIGIIIAIMSWVINWPVA